MNILCKSQEQKKIRSRTLEWLNRYYPIPASELRSSSNAECLKHSLKKWIGLSRAKSYGLVLQYGSLREEKRNIGIMRVDSDSCALCNKHTDMSTGDIDCSGCPLKISLGRACDSLNNNLYLRSLDDPKLMVDALRAAIKHHRKMIDDLE